MITETILEEHSIIHKKYSGEISFDDLISGSLNTINTMNKGNYRKLLVCFEKVTTNVIAKDARRYVNFLKEHPSRLPHNIAIIVTTPTTTAVAYLFKMAQRNMYNVEIFCTQEGAMEWLRELSND